MEDLGHEHLQEALFEVADLGPDVLVHLARAGHMLRRHNQAVPRDQPPPVAAQTMGRSEGSALLVLPLSTGNSSTIGQCLGTSRSLLQRRQWEGQRVLRF